MKSRLLLVIILLVVDFGKGIYAQGTPWSYVQLSTEMIEAHLHGQNTDHFLLIFKDCEIDQLSKQISSDPIKITFWVNIYNGYILHILRKDSTLYNDRNAFFNAKQINIGGHLLSFSDIEHGILRRSQHPLMLGYVKRWCVSDFEKKLRVDKRDYRIHFALNCGAKSCPPVRAYNYIELDTQLDQNAKHFLYQTTQCSSKKCAVSSIFSWFRGDFGGAKRIYKVLKRYQIIGSDAPKPSISYTNYDWTLDLNNFSILEK